MESAIATENDASCTLVELHHLTQGNGSLYRDKRLICTTMLCSVQCVCVCVKLQEAKDSA